MFSKDFLNSSTLLGLGLFDRFALVFATTVPVELKLLELEDDSLAAAGAVGALVSAVLEELKPLRLGLQSTLLLLLLPLGLLPLMLLEALPLFL